MMTVSELADAAGYEIISMPRGDDSITGVFTGDLLSHVMGRLTEGAAWVTIMNNINVLAVASLTGCSCVIVADGSELSAEFTATATEKEINVLRCAEPAAEACIRVGGCLK